MFSKIITSIKINYSISNLVTLIFLLISYLLTISINTITIDFFNTANIFLYTIIMYFVWFCLFFKFSKVGNNNTILLCCYYFKSLRNSFVIITNYIKIIFNLNKIDISYAYLLISTNSLYWYTIFKRHSYFGVYRSNRHDWIDQRLEESNFLKY